MVWEAYRRVKANKGAAGVDGLTIEQYEQDVKNNLFKLWNRLSSGRYFPPPVKAVAIPKASGKGVRILGVPIVDDRIAQTTVAMYLERQVEPTSFPPRLLWLPPGAVCFGCSGEMPGALLEERLGHRFCIFGRFSSSVDHTLMLKAVARHTDQKWILLYVAAVAYRAVAAARWHASRPGSGDSTGFSDLAGFGEPVSALCVRYVAGPRVSGRHVRALLR